MARRRLITITREIARETCPAHNGDGCPASRRNPPDKPCVHRTRYRADCRACDWTATRNALTELEQVDVSSHHGEHPDWNG